MQLPCSFEIILKYTNPKHLYTFFWWWEYNACMPCLNEMRYLRTWERHRDARDTMEEQTTDTSSGIETGQGIWVWICV